MTEGFIKLYCSVVAGDTKVVERAMDSGLIEDPSSAQRLAHMAAYKGQMTILRLLLTNFPPDNTTNAFGETLLHTAVREGKTDIIPELVSRGENLNSADLHGRTPLMWALINGHFEAALKLISYHCDVNCRDENGNTPLLMSIRFGNEDLVEALLNAGGKISFTGPELAGTTALHEAISRYASMNILKKVISRGGSYLDTPNETGLTPLMLAITHSSIHAVKVLLNANCQVNYTARVMNFGYHNITPLQHCLHQILFPLAQQTTSRHVTMKRIRNQMAILSMLILAGTRWLGTIPSLHTLVGKITSYLRQQYGEDDFFLIVSYQLNEVVNMLSSPSSLLELCRQHFRSLYGSQFEYVVRNMPFAPYFQDFLLLGDLERFSCDYLTPGN